MSTANASAPRTQTVAAPRTPEEERNAQLLREMFDRPFTFTPFQAKDEITLTARSVLRYLAKPTRQGKMPTEQDAVRFMMLCKARGLNPWEGDAFLIGYDGQDGPEFNLITAHQAFLKRAEIHPDYDGMESGVVCKRRVLGTDGKEKAVTVEYAGDLIEDGDTLLGGWARIHFKGKSVPCYQRLRLSVFDTGRSRWKKDPAGMIVKCSESAALRQAFPNQLGGMYFEGEMQSVENRERDKSADAERIANRLGQRAAPLPEPVLGNGTANTPDTTEPAAGTEEQPSPDYDEPTPDRQPGDDGDGEDLELANILDDLAQRIAAMETDLESNAIGADMLRERKRMGEENYERLLSRFQEKNRERAATKKGAKK